MSRNTGNHRLAWLAAGSLALFSAAGPAWSQASDSPAASVWKTRQVLGYDVETLAALAVTVDQHAAILTALNEHAPSDAPPVDPAGDAALVTELREQLSAEQQALHDRQAANRGLDPLLALVAGDHGRAARAVEGGAAAAGRGPAGFGQLASPGGPEGGAGGVRGGARPDPRAGAGPGA